jgi:ADP-L-glycero-D-manno-heptose 6-epimerase
MNKNIKIACTGGAGFIASNIIKHLNQEGYTNIDVYEKLDTLDKKLHNILSLNINGVYDYNDLLEIAYQYDWVLHIGADSSTKTKPEDYERVLEQNFYYTQKLLNGCFGINSTYNPNRKFIFASSASVYGNSDDFTERLDCVPQHLYGLTKLFCDRAIQKLIDEKPDVKIYSYRFYNCAGFNEKHKIERNMASPISKFLLQEPPFILYRNENKTEFKRDFIHVKNIADVIYFTLVNDCQSGCYNLGSGNGTTWEELVRVICEVRGLKYEDSIKYEPLPEVLKNQYQAITVANLEKLRNVLGYKGEFTGIREIVQDIFKNLKYELWF